MTTPDLPAEAVEAACAAFYNNPAFWKALAEHEPMIAERHRTSMRRALTAALPLLPTVLDRDKVARAIDEANSNFAPDPEDDEDGNFHRWSRELADAVIAMARTEAEVKAEARNEIFREHLSEITARDGEFYASAFRDGQMVALQDAAAEMGGTIALALRRRAARLREGGQP